MDRYIHSTIASHSVIIGEHISSIGWRIVNESDIILPDYVIFLDVDTDTAFERIYNRGKLSRNELLLEDKRELMDLMRDKYISLLKWGKFQRKGFIIIDTTDLSIDEVLDRAREYVSGLLN